MAFFEIIQYSLGILMVILLSYQLILSIFGLRKKNILDATQNHQFAIIIPAPKNEEMISKSLYSLFGLVYPKNLYDVIMVGDSFSNNAVNIAREMGAIVLNRDSENQDKNISELQWAFEQVIQGEKDYNALLVVESSSLVSGNYLDVMDYYLDNGSDIVQSSNLILPQFGFQGNKVKQISFLLYNLVKPVRQKVFGFNMGLQGNGICFTTQILRKNPWLLNSLKQEMGYELKLQLEGLNMDFVPEAVLLTEVPKESQSSDTKQNRWNLDRFSTVKHYAPELIKATFQHKSLSHFQSLLNLITPSSVTMFMIAVVIGIMNVLMWIVADGSLSFVWLWISVAVLGMGHIIVELYGINAYYQSYKSML